MIIKQSSGMSQRKLIFMFLIIMSFLSACKTEISKEEELEQKEYELVQKENELAQRELAVKQKEEELESADDLQQESITNSTNTDVNFPNEIQENKPIIETKYVFIRIKTNEPELEEIEIGGSDKNERFTFNGVDFPIEHIEPRKFAKSQYYTYTSDIYEIVNFTEDKKYQAIDQYAKSVRRQLSIVDMNFSSKYNGAQPSQYNAEATIVSKEAYVFNSYREASIAK